MIDVLEYVDSSGLSPFEQWFESLDYSVQARVVVSLDRVESGISNAKGAGRSVLEIRLDFGAGYRIYFGQVGDRTIIPLGGGSMKRQRSDNVAAQHL